jgi:UDP-GlcNAc3NAcA epimerase
LTDLANSGKKIIFPVHPRTKKVFEAHGLFTGSIPENLLFSEPLSYMDILALESNARLILTDSGGIQKEGYFFDTPCVIVREQSEWVELLEIGWNALTGADRDKIMDAVNHFWNQKLEKTGGAIFGNGDASDKIARILQEH